ncbi:unnamed protein product [Discosporangium mesarthrocarpum]
MRCIALGLRRRATCEQVFISDRWFKQVADHRVSRRSGSLAQLSTETNGEDGGRTRTRTLNTILVHHPDCELHNIAGHPERPARVKVIMSALRKAFPGMAELLAPEVTLEQILRVHPQEHVDNILECLRLAEAAPAPPLLPHPQGAIKPTVEKGNAVVRIDMDTAVMPGSRWSIMRAAGALCLAVDEVMSGRATNAFCCVRPPGHHAEPAKAMGFCFFSNATIGARHAQEVHGVERVAVIDFDVHHGNGTQQCFKHDPTTFYGSTHQVRGRE